MPALAMRPPTAAELDALAAVVAAALEADDLEGAWVMTRALEEVAGLADEAVAPAGPVIGRRFARAHRLLLARAGTDDRRFSVAA